MGQGAVKALLGAHGGAKHDGAHDPDGAQGVEAIGILHDGQLGILGDGEGGLGGGVGDFVGVGDVGDDVLDLGCQSGGGAGGEEEGGCSVAVRGVVRWEVFSVVDVVQEAGEGDEMAVVGRGGVHGALRGFDFSGPVEHALDVCVVV